MVSHNLRLFGVIQLSVNLRDRRRAVPKYRPGRIDTHIAFGHWIPSSIRHEVVLGRSYTLG